MMRGKVCVITGASSGIGLATAEALGRQGFRLVLTGRDPARCEAALTLLRSRVPGLEARFHYADLSSIAEMHRLGNEIAAEEQRIDVLINNAGIMNAQRLMTVDGLERMFAVNHLAYYVVTDRLKLSVAAAAPSRIVNVASEAHRGQVLDLHDLQCERGFRAMAAYGRSKLANILYTRELSRRLETAGVTVNSLHPGFIASRIGNDAPIGMRLAIGAAKAMFAKNVARGAETPVFLATSPTVAEMTARYFVDKREVAPSAAAQDDSAAAMLWQESARLTGLHP
jgi:retinol dehydrogenase-12